MGFALTPGEAPLHFSRSKNVMHVAGLLFIIAGIILDVMAKNDRKTFVIDTNKIAYNKRH